MRRVTVLWPAFREQVSCATFSCKIQYCWPLYTSKHFSWQDSCCYKLCRGVPRNLKGEGGRNFLFTQFHWKYRWRPKIKQTGLHVFRRPIYPSKSSEDQKKKVNASSDVLFPLFRWLQIYISLYFSGRGGSDPSAPPMDTSLLSGNLTQVSSRTFYTRRA